MKSNLSKVVACLLTAAVSMGMAGCSFSFKIGDIEDMSKADSSSSKDISSVSEIAEEDILEENSSKENKEDNSVVDTDTDKSLSIDEFMKLSSEAVGKRKSVSVTADYLASFSLSYGDEFIYMPVTMTADMDINKDLGCHFIMDLAMDINGEAQGNTTEKYVVVNDNGTTTYYDSDDGGWITETKDRDQNKQSVDMSILVFDENSNVFDGAELTKLSNGGYMIRQKFDKVFTSEDTSMIGVINTAVSEISYSVTGISSIDSYIEYEFDKDYLPVSVTIDEITVDMDSEAIFGDPNGEASYTMSYNITFFDWDIVPDNKLDVPDEVIAMAVDSSTDVSNTDNNLLTNTSDITAIGSITVDNITIAVPASNFSAPSGWQIESSDAYGVSYSNPKYSTVRISTRVENNITTMVSLTVGNFDEAPSLKIADKITWGYSREDAESVLDSLVAGNSSITKDSDTTASGGGYIFYTDKSNNIRMELQFSADKGLYSVTLKQI